MKNDKFHSFVLVASGIDSLLSLSPKLFYQSGFYVSYIGKHLVGKERAQFSSVLTNGRDHALQAHYEDER